MVHILKQYTFEILSTYFQLNSTIVIDFITYYILFKPYEVNCVTHLGMGELISGRITKN